MSINQPTTIAETRRIKLLLLTEPMGGGIRRYIHDVVYGLDPNLFDITLVYGASRTDKSFQDNLQQMCEHATLIPCNELVREVSLQHDWRAIRAVIRIMRQVQPDIVHCNSSKAGVIGRVAAKLQGIPAIYSSHGWAMQNIDFGRRKKQIFAGIEAVLSRFATATTINVSPTEKQCALDWHINSSNQFIVISNGVDPSTMLSREESRARLGLSDNAIVVGTAIRLTAQKDPLQIIDIFARAHQQNPALHLAILGDGELRDAVKQAINENGIEQAVTCYGYRADASQLMAAFDVVMMTSTAEGLPYTLLEAEAVGVPIVATNVEGIRDIVKPGVTGELFPFGDVEQGANALLSVLDATSALASVNEAGEGDMDAINMPYSRQAIYHDFMQRFSLNLMIKELTSVYQRFAKTSK
ncbi:glycosyltransferase [Galliscardovia ingluviei]|nr:glycosyltransferase [Galliscardovia ingluviei]